MIQEKLQKRFKQKILIFAISLNSEAAMNELNFVLFSR